METITGVVGSLDPKEWNGKVLHSFRLNGDNRYFRTGEQSPGVQPGQAIRFVVTKKGNNWQADVGSIEAIAAGEVVNAPPAASAAGPAPSSPSPVVDVEYNPHRDYSNKDNYWARKEAGDTVREERINYAAAQRDAVALVTAALDQDCLSFGNTNKGKKLDMLLEFVDQVTERFAEQRKAAGLAVAESD